MKKLLVLVMIVLFSTSSVLGHNKVVVIPLVGTSGQPEQQPSQFIPISIKGFALSHATVGNKMANATLNTDITIDDNGIVDGTAVVVWPDGQPSSFISIESGALVVTTGTSMIDLLSRGNEENWMVDGEPYKPGEIIGQILEEVNITPFSEWSVLALNFSAIAVLFNLPAWQVNSVIAQQIGDTAPSLFCKVASASLTGIIAGALIAGCAAAVASCAAGTAATLGGTGVPCAFVAIACTNAVLGGTITAISIIVYDLCLEYLWKGADVYDWVT